jgi:sulfane dehydrogenase subunit SoxC
MKSIQSGRRQFLKNSAALVGAAAGGMRLSDAEETLNPEVIHSSKGFRELGGPSRYEKLVRSGISRHCYTPLADLQHGIITPSNLHFVENNEQGLLMDLAPEKHRLMIFGLVDRPLVFTMAELKRLPSVARIHFLECNGNSSYKDLANAKTVQSSHGRVSCSEWTGVLLSTLLKEAGVKKEATWVVAVSADPSKHAASIPMEKAMDDALVAYGQNGEALQLDQGYPLRLLLPGWGGRRHVKWLEALKVVDEPYMTSQDRTGELDHESAGVGGYMVGGTQVLADHFQAFVKSVITFPSGGQQLPGPGFYEITGLAWSGAGSVSRVEVSTDNGRTWQDAQLQEPVLPKALTRFRFPWTWDGTEAVLQSRSTDEHGDRQPSASETSKNWSSDSSEACISTMGEAYCKQIPRRAYYSYIMPWRVAANGNVSNAFVLTPEMLKLQSRPIHFGGASPGTGISEELGGVPAR